MNRTNLLAGGFALFVISGCKSISDIDMSNKDANCSTQCLANHSECTSGISMMPIRINNLCADAMRACVQACPTKNQQATQSKDTKDIPVQGSSDIYLELKKLAELKDSGILTQEEFDARKKKILAQ